MRQSPAQQRVWRHNGLRGGVKMIKAILTSIASAPSTTLRSKHRAKLLLSDLEELEESIKERVDS